MLNVPVEHLTVSHGSDIKDALVIIDRNGLGLAFVLSDEGKLAGIVTDGNIRRALIDGAKLSDNVAVAMTVDCVSLPVSASPESIAEKLNSRIHVIPLLDVAGRPVDYASHFRHHRIPVMEPSLSGNELNYTIECLKTNWISSQGSFVKRFEDEFSRFIGVGNSLAVCNGTAALHVALDALGVGQGDEVIVPDLTFAATINAVLYCGAVPVLADVDPETWCMDAKGIESLVTPRTKAIIPVHLYGQPADMEGICRLAGEHGLYVIEDAAEALGALHHGRHVGSFGDAAAFSFFGNKIITTGEGGMVVFRDEAVASRARMLRDHGMDPQKRYWHPQVGYNYRLTNLQAAIGVAQLEQIEGFIQRKIRIGRDYRRRLESIDAIRLPVEREGVRNVYWLFSVILDSRRSVLGRDDLMERLRACGIETRPLFYPLHTMPPYRQYSGKRDFPNAQRLSANGLSMPSAVTLKENEIEFICDRIRSIVAPCGT